MTAPDQPSIVQRLRADTRSAAHCALSNEAAGRIEALEGALRGTTKTLGKIVSWLGRLATASERAAKNTSFASLAEANAADGKNFRNTVKSITPAIEKARAVLAMNSEPNCAHGVSQDCPACAEETITSLRSKVEGLTAALENIHSFDITPNTGYSVAQAMRRTAALALNSQERESQ